MTPTRLDLAIIRTTGGTQTRAATHQPTVDEYAEAMKAGVEFPAVSVVFDGEDYWLADGFHRVAAAKQAGLNFIDADIAQGTRRDAVLASVGANASHGLRRTNEDKRRAVETLLRDEEWSAWSDRQIADACRVSHTFVGQLRRAVTGNNASERTYTTRHGTVATMNTANIGGKAGIPQARPNGSSIYNDIEEERFLAEKHAGSAWIDRYKAIQRYHATKLVLIVTETHVIILRESAKAAAATYTPPAETVNTEHGEALFYPRRAGFPHPGGPVVAGLQMHYRVVWYADDDPALAEFVRNHVFRVPARAASQPQPAETKPFAVGDVVRTPSGSVMRVAEVMTTGNLVRIESESDEGPAGWAAVERLTLVTPASSPALPVGTRVQMRSGHTGVIAGERGDAWLIDTPNGRRVYRKEYVTAIEDEAVATAPADHPADAGEMVTSAAEPVAQPAPVELPDALDWLPPLPWKMGGYDGSKVIAADGTEVADPYHNGGAGKEIARLMVEMFNARFAEFAQADEGELAPGEHVYYLDWTNGSLTGRTWRKVRVERLGGVRVQIYHPIEGKLKYVERKSLCRRPFGLPLPDMPAAQPVTPVDSPANILSDDDRVAGWLEGGDDPAIEQALAGRETDAVPLPAPMRRVAAFAPGDDLDGIMADLGEAEAWLEDRAAIIQQAIDDDIASLPTDGTGGYDDPPPADDTTTDSFRFISGRASAGRWS